jgi:hypothetical protein
MDREEHAAGEDKLMELGRAVESSGEEIGVLASRQPVHSTDQPIRCPRLKMGATRAAPRPLGQRVFLG